MIFKKHQSRIAAKDNSTHIYSIDILRIWLCFEVILSHYWVYTNDGNIILDFFSRSRRIAVGCFMFVSFLLTAPYLTKWADKREKLTKRLTRLYTPIIAWAIAYYIIYLSAHLILNFEFDTSPVNLLIQLVTGHSYNRPMWFINDLLYLTLFFLPILALKHKKAKVILLMSLMGISLFLQHSGLTGEWFGKMDEAISYPLGRFVEQLPYAAAALLFALLDLKKRIENHRLSVFISLAVTATLTALFLKIPIAYSFGSAGLSLLIGSVAVAMMFYLVPNRIILSPVANLTKFAAKYSLGIYCMHVMIGTALCEIFINFHLQPFTFTMCISIFVICLIICRCIALLPYKWCKASVS